MTEAHVERLVATLGRWADQEAAVSALALIGSWARGTARPDSDLDMIVLGSDATASLWAEQALARLSLAAARFEVIDRRDVTYGAVWSAHLSLSPDAELELTFAPPDWASLDPIDVGTRRVVGDGFRILSDKAGRFALLQAAIARLSD